MFFVHCMEYVPADKQEQDRHDDSNFRISGCLEKNKRKRRSKASVRTLAALTFGQTSFFGVSGLKRVGFEWQRQRCAGRFVHAQPERTKMAMAPEDQKLYCGLWDQCGQGAPGVAAHDGAESMGLIPSKKAWFCFWTSG